MDKVNAKITGPVRPMTQVDKRKLTLEKARVILTEYGGGKTSQRGIINRHEVTQPTITNLIKGTWFKDWECHPWFVELRLKAQEVAASRSAHVTKAVSVRTPDASKVYVDISSLAVFDAEIERLLSIRPMLAAKAAKAQLEDAPKLEPTRW